MQKETYPGMILSEAMYVSEIEAPPVTLSTAHKGKSLEISLLVLESHID
jgi:hypothetical protein